MRNGYKGSSRRFATFPGENKHAYLIMAHGDYRCLCSLLASIDHIRHDVYIHIDKKWKDFDENKLRCVVKESNMYYIKRRSIS